MKAKTSILSVLATGAMLAGVTACGGGALDGMDADEIAEKARTSMAELSSLRMEAELGTPEEGGVFDVAMSTDGDCRGSMSMEGAEVEFMVVGGTSYMRGDESFWSQQGMDGESMRELVGDRWIVAPEGQGGFAETCQLDSFLEDLNSDSDEDRDWERVDGETIDGTETVGITRTEDDGSTVTVYVADDDDAHILRMVNDSETDGGTVEFSEFDEDIDVEAPADEDTVDFAELMGA
ncbi:hypothetical protein FNQ90_13475 [Streptomyces alkaliphilus]|uniref:Lipoprotein n=1 Tax=Streptomyces alkaliphilus TaxID=1472722 RepID=A0A7W3TDX3_9ACTN|nr:hypothetical protein [Streptomyces alkaliphilus]MBB0245088.1 hypothetical protein [Streptomyces alkaliphilus]